MARGAYLGGAGNASGLAIGRTGDPGSCNVREKEEVAALYETALADTGSGYRRTTDRRKRRSVYSEVFEEDAVEENDNFRLMELGRFQIVGDRGKVSHGVQCQYG